MRSDTAAVKKLSLRGANKGDVAIPWRTQNAVPTLSSASGLLRHFVPRNDNRRAISVPYGFLLSFASDRTTSLPSRALGRVSGVSLPSGVLATKSKISAA